MNKYFLSTIFYFAVLSLSSQIQLSDFEDLRNVTTTSEFNTANYVVSSGREYYIERALGNTKIFESLCEELTLIHDLSHYPDNQTETSVYFPTQYVSDPDNELLYEGYGCSIVITNIATGELIETIDFCDEKIKLKNKIYSRNDASIIFKGERNFNDYIYKYNINSNSIEEMPWSDDIRSIEVVGNYLYQTSDNEQQLIAYNTITGTEEAILTIDQGIKYYEIRREEMESYLMVLGNDNSIHRIRNSEILESIDCYKNTNKNVLDIFVQENIITLAYVIGTDVYISIISKLDCTELKSEKLNKSIGNRWPFFSKSNKESSNIISFIYSSNTNKDEFYLIDNIDLTITRVDVSADNIFTPEIIENDKVIVVTSDIFPGFIYSKRCYRYDLNTEEIDTIPLSPNSLIDGIKTSSICNEGNILITTTNNLDNEEKWKYNIITNDLTLLDQSTLKTNVGIRFNGWLEHKVANDKLYFSQTSGIYVIKNNETQILIEGNATLSFLERDNFIYTLIVKNDTIYQVEINTIDDSVIVKSTNQEGINNIKKFATSNAIFNFNTYKGEGYYDIDENEYITLESPLNTSSLELKETSLDNAIFCDFNDGDWKWYSYNTKTKTTLQYDNLGGSGWSEANGNGKGAFIVVPESDGNITPKRIYVIDKSGEIIQDPILEYSSNFYRINKRLTNEMLTVPLPGDSLVHFILLKGTDFKTIQVENHKSRYHLTFDYFAGKDMVVTESTVGDENQSVFFSYDIEPRIIFTYGRGISLIGSIFYENSVTTLHLDESNHKLLIDEYDFNNDEIINSYEIDVIKYGHHNASLLGQISAYKYALTFNNGKHGNELFILNDSTKTIELFADVAKGKKSSHPNLVTPINNEIYFTAFGENGEQWYKHEIKEEEEENQDVLVETELSSIQVYPNPAIEVIKIDSLLKDFKIFDTQNICIYQKAEIDNDIIDISTYPNGVYFMEAINNNGKIVRGKFVVAR